MRPPWRSTTFLLMAGVFGRGMQALEDDEEPVEILGVNADAVVAHPEHPLLFLPGRAT